VEEEDGAREMTAEEKLFEIPDHIKIKDGLKDKQADQNINWVSGIVEVPVRMILLLIQVLLIFLTSRSKCKYLLDGVSGIGEVPVGSVIN
jgi:hypothetical protein